MGAAWTSIGSASCPGRLAATVHCDAPVYQVRDVTSETSIVSLARLTPISGQLEIRTQNGSSWLPVCASSWKGTGATVCSSVFHLNALSEGNSTNCLMWNSCGNWCSFMLSPAVFWTPASLELPIIAFADWLSSDNQDDCGYPYESSGRVVNCAPAPGDFEAKGWPASDKR